MCLFKEETCCFIGHRRLPKEKIEQIVSKLDREVENLIEKGITNFILGGSLGFDQLAALLIAAKKEIKRDIHLIFALPYKNQYRCLSTGQYLLAKADKVIYVSEECTDDCMEKRNRYLIDNSSHYICALLHPISETDGAMKYARQKGLNIINITY